MRKETHFPTRIGGNLHLRGRCAVSHRLAVWHTVMLNSTRLTFSAEQTVISQLSCRAGGEENGPTATQLYYTSHPLHGVCVGKGESVQVEVVENAMKSQLTSSDPIRFSEQEMDGSGWPQLASTKASPAFLGGFLSKYWSGPTVLGF